LTQPLNLSTGILLRITVAGT